MVLIVTLTLSTSRAQQVDFAAQEIARETATPNRVRIDERIFYLEPGPLCCTDQ